VFESGSIPVDTRVHLGDSEPKGRREWFCTVFVVFVLETSVTQVRLQDANVDNVETLLGLYLQSKKQRSSLGYNFVTVTRERFKIWRFILVTLPVLQVHLLET
jgi:hypothetical protein